MTNAIAVTNGLRAIEKAVPTLEEIEVIKATVMPPGSTDAELKTFLGWCGWKGLDPVGQAYVIRQKNKDGTVKLTFGTSIHGMRSIAARTGLYGPQDGPYWCGPDGEWKDLWLSTDNPAAARVGVKQVGWDTYTYGTATWSQWGKTFGNWTTMPAHMLAIRAEADALRRAFPHDLAGVFTREEMEEAAPEPAKPPVGSRVDAVEAQVRRLLIADPAVEVYGDVIDAETGEVTGQQSLPGDDAVNGIDMITRAQAERIIALRKALGLSAGELSNLAAKAAGRVDAIDPRQLSTYQADALMIELEAMARAEDIRVTAS